MIDYELALELKKAGFPQEPEWHVDVNAWGGSWYLLLKDEACSMPVFATLDSYKAGVERGDNLVKLPTLSELIEACGVEFGALRRDVVGAFYAHDPKRRLFGRGETPDISLAKLWLELAGQKKKSDVANRNLL